MDCCCCFFKSYAISITLVSVNLKYVDKNTFFVLKHLFTFNMNINNHSNNHSLQDICKRKYLLQWKSLEKLCTALASFAVQFILCTSKFPGFLKIIIIEFGLSLSKYCTRHHFLKVMIMFVRAWYESCYLICLITLILNSLISWNLNLSIIL